MLQKIDPMSWAFREEKIDARIREIWSARVRDKVSLSARWKRGGRGFESPPPAEGGAGWKPLPEGGLWGRDTETTIWVRLQARVPEGWRHKVVLHVVPEQCELLAYVDGKALGALDLYHHAWVLSERGRPGTCYDIALDAYCGLTVIGTTPEVGGNRAPMRGIPIIELLSIDAETEGLARDMRFALDTARQLDDTSIERHRIVRVLDETVNALDFRRGTEDERFHASARAARARLREALYSGAPSHLSRPTIHAVGHAHIDTAWLWRLDHTRRKCVRTFTTAVSLMERYPEYVFTCSQPQQYAYIESDSPALFERIRGAVKKGQWEPVGGMWVEADCNVSSGESLVRQFVYGLRYFEKAFGRHPKVVWLPDVFGYSAAFPQIMRKAGMRYFMTTKIFWNQVNRPPYQTFEWHGIDNTSVLVHFSPNGDYNALMTPAQLADLWTRYDQKSLNSELLYIYGHGDGGGGPTEEMCESAERAHHFVAGPEVVRSSAEAFFERLEASLTDVPHVPRWVGELYLEYHRGTYTSQGRTKQGNRRSEIALQTAEQVAAAAMLTCGAAYPQSALEEAWKLVLLNQFHDILPGSSIAEVYQDAAADYASIAKTTTRTVNDGLKAIAAGCSGKTVVVFNPLSWARRDPLSLPSECGLPGQAVTDLDGTERLLAVPREALPSVGWAALAPEDIVPPEKGGDLKASRKGLENRFFRLTFDASGEITSLYDKRHQREVLRPLDGVNGNTLIAFEDKPMNWDAWDIDVFYQDKPHPLRGRPKITVSEKGPLRASVDIERAFDEGRGSVVRQRISLHRDLERIDFETWVDWKERQTLLKVAFPVAVNAARAAYDIQFGHVERPTHWNTSWDWARFEVCAHKWADLSEGDYGVALLSDSKYGWDIRDGVMRLTLLKSAIAPDATADLGVHHFRYALMPHAGDWRSAEVVRRGYELNVPTPSVPVPSRARGDVASRVSLVTTEAPNLVIETVKKAEDSDALVVRLYEAFNQRGRGVLRFDRPVLEARCVDLLERGPDGDAPCVDGETVAFDYGPFEIKTVWIRLASRKNRKGR